MSTPFKPEWLQPGAVVPVDIPTLAAFAEELRRVNQALETEKQWVGLNHFDRTLLRTTHAPVKMLHYITETDTDIVAEVVNDWEAFFTAIEAKLKEKNT